MREDEQKLTRTSWMIVLGLGLATALVLWQVTSAKNRDRAAVEALQKAKADLVASLQGFNVDLEEGAQQAVALAEEKKRTWEGKDIEAEVKKIRARALKTIETAKERKDLEGGLTAIEQGLENQDALGIDALAEYRRRIDEAENKVVLELSPGNEATVHRQAVTKVIDQPAEETPVVPDDASSLTVTGTEAPAAPETPEETIARLNKEDKKDN